MIPSKPYEAMPEMKSEDAKETKTGGKPKYLRGDELPVATTQAALTPAKYANTSELPFLSERSDLSVAQHARRRRGPKKPAVEGPLRLICRPERHPPNPPVSSCDKITLPLTLTSHTTY